jgi:addiction module RelB/DinJ family antitoxin
MELNIEQELLNQASQLFSKLGLTTEQAIRIFLTKSISSKGLPFPIILDEQGSFAKPSITNNQITDTLLTLVEQGLPEAELLNLQNPDYCKEVFALSFAVLKQAKSNQQADIKIAAQDGRGHNRYSTKKVAHHKGQYYVICTQWTDRHRALFSHWHKHIQRNTSSVSR